ncbi:MAG: exodeoxyribonuclease VII large subunit [Sphaerochaetaceae bacterium]|nr:exodeoxyribonuclease VII large subunit [Sphaerochaetaceae bacterium]
MDGQGLLDGITLSVGDLTALLKQTIEGSFYGLTVEGEISNFRPSSTGHWYFTLKDERAALNAVMFKNKLWRLPFIPKNGDKVVVTGKLDVYEQRGTYQIICESMKQTGTGDLLALLEERKQAYAKAGYFDEIHKKPLPDAPSRVVVITSPTGAALRDILQILRRRATGLDVLILPAPVQGDEAAKIIAARIDQANRFLLGDVIIVGRGGGSLEDLLPFSEPCVIEAIYRSEIPIVSAVGHEIDWALSDFVADMRAPTPSAAAELVSKSSSEQLVRLQGMKRTLSDALLQKAGKARLSLRQFQPQMFGDILQRRIEQFRYKLDDSSNDIEQTIGQRLRNARHSLQLLENELKGLSPIAILERGYAVVTDSDGKVVADTATLSTGDRITIRFAKGGAEALVEQVRRR